MVHVTAIVSGKGGVGKTTTSINVGSALTSFGKRVVVIDADLRNPNVALHLGSASPPVTVHHVLEGKKHLFDAVYKHNQSGLRIVPGSISFVHAREASFDHLPVLREFMQGLGDHVLVDGPPGVGDEVKSVLELADDALVVTSPDLPAVVDALKVVKLAQSLGKRVVGAVINRHVGDGSDLAVENVASLLGVPVVGVVREDAVLREALRMRHPAVFSHPHAPASLDFKRLAANLIGKEFVAGLPQQKSWWQGWRS